MNLMPSAPTWRLVLDTGLRNVWTQKTTTELFVPVTVPLDTTHIKEVRTAMELVGITGAFKCRPAYRMSDDGITWSATETNIMIHRTSNGWFFDEGAMDSITTDQKLFVQFGFQGANVSGSQVEHGMARLRLQARDVKGQSQMASRQKVWTDGTTTAIFNALTAPILVETVGEYRATLELVTNSGDVQVQPGYQVSNDRRTWYSGAASAAAGTFTSFGTNRTSEGIDYATTFTSFSPAEAKQYVRFGVAGKNGTAGKPETGRVNLRVDVRRS